MDNIRGSLSPDGSVVIIAIEGYFNHIVGDRAIQLVDSYSLEGHTRFLFDFSKCSLINSPGVASMVDILMKVTDDFKGMLVLVGLDQMKWTIFKMVRVVPTAPSAPTLEEGLKLFY